MSYWRDLIGRINGSVKRNFLDYGIVALIVIGMVIGFAVQTYLCVFLCRLIPMPASAAISFLDLGGLMGFALSVFLSIFQILLYFDYDDFKERQHLKNGEMWRRRRQ